MQRIRTRTADVRGLLAPLSELAQRRQVAVVGVNHLNKSAAGGPAMYRTMGSLAFVAAARAAWAVVKDKQDGGKRLFLPIKNNLAADIAGLSYTVVEQDGHPCLAWSPDAVTVSVDEAMATDKPNIARRRATGGEGLAANRSGRRPVGREGNREPGRPRPP